MTIVKVTLVLIGTAAYLGLTSLGWGGWPAFFAHPALVALALAVLAGVSLFAGGNLSPGLREDRSNRWVIVALALLGLLAASLPASTDRQGFWTIDGEPMRWLGVVLFAAGGALRLWPVFVLGPRFSGLVAIQPGHMLVTSGVYGVIPYGQNIRTRLPTEAAPGKFEVKSPGALSHGNDVWQFALVTIPPQTLRVPL